MIQHVLRFKVRDDAPKGTAEGLLASLERMGKQIPAVAAWTAGEDVAAYREYMSAPVHREADFAFIPLLKDVMSFDIVSDPDPTVPQQIRKVVQDRFASDPELVALVSKWKDPDWARKQR